MKAIVEYTSERDPANRYPERIVSPPRPVLMVHAFRARIRLLHKGEVWSLKK